MRKDIVALLLVLIAVVAGICFVPGLLHRLRIEREFRAEMSRVYQGKSMDLGGRSHSFQDISVTDFSEGPKGCELKFTIQWDDAVTLTGGVLTDNGFGSYVYDAIDLVAGAGHISFAITK